ncbi:MAG: hypothetical protein ACM3YM_06550 [Sphingomonadales bacterium]
MTVSRNNRILIACSALALSISAFPSGAAAQSTDDPVIATGWSLHPKPKRARPLQAPRNASSGNHANGPTVSQARPRVFGGAGVTNMTGRNRARSGAHLGVAVPF